MSESQRAYIYRVVVALAPVVVAYGYASGKDVALWLAFAAAVLGNGLAAVNTSTKG